MYELRKLSVEEVEREMESRKPSPRTEERRKMIEEFKQFLSGLQPGEGGEIKYENRRQRMTIKNRLKKAAEELGIEIEFIRKRGRIVFRIPNRSDSSQNNGSS